MCCRFVIGFDFEVLDLICWLYGFEVSVHGFKVYIRFSVLWTTSYQELLF